MNTNFIPIEKSTWNRNDEFEHFIKFAPCTFSITADVDITELYNEIKKKNCKLYPALVAVMVQVINEHKEFRYFQDWRDKEAKLGYFEVLHPLFFDVIESTKNVKVLYAEYNQNLSDMIKEIEKVRDEYKNCDVYAPQKDMPINTVNISCVPWVKFTNLSFSLPMSSTYFFPIIAFGKYEKKDGKVIIPLSVHVNHATNDGYHSSLIFNEFEKKSKAFL